MSVYKRGDKGVFYMNFTVNGVRVYRSTGKFTKKEAKHYEAMERQKMMENAALSPKEKRAKMMYSEAIKKVYDERWKDGKDGNGSYRNAEIVMELIGDIQISKIDEDVVEVLIRKLEARGIKPATVNRFLAALKTTLRHNKQMWEHIKLKKVRSGRIRVISKEEESMVVSLLKSDKAPRRKHYPEVADLVEILVDTGCRLSEILDLKYDDVNFEANLISIWVNKGERPRSIPMTRRVGTILQTRRTEGTTSKPFNIDRDQAENAWTWVRKSMGLAGDKEFVLHALRHTCATRLVNKGVDLYVVKEYLGHSSIQITEKYAHLNPSKLAYAAEMLEDRGTTADAEK